MIAMPLEEFRKSKNSPLRFQPVDQVERKQFSQHAGEVQRLREERRTLETNPLGTRSGTRIQEGVPANMRLPGSPIVAKPGANLGKDRVVPKAYDAPKLDTKVVPKSRAIRSTEQPQTQRQPQPKAERAAPQPKAERQAPQPQPKAERQAPQPRGKDPAGPKQDNPKDKDKK
jgi:hypothetical protein